MKRERRKKVAARRRRGSSTAPSSTAGDLPLLNPTDCSGLGLSRHAAQLKRNNGIFFISAIWIGEEPATMRIGEEQATMRIG
jgi:hypothetical protein